MSAHIRSCMSSSIVWIVYVGFVVDIDIKILGVPPLGLGMPFLDNDTCAERGGGGGVIYLCQGFLPCMMPSMDGWMGHMKKLHEKRPRRPLLYVMFYAFCFEYKNFVLIALWVYVATIIVHIDELNLDINVLTRFLYFYMYV